MALPTVLMTDVIRSSQQGDSHGGAYLIDLESGAHERVLDWNEVGIDWEGRGMGRGLRGIAFVGEEIYIAASDELFVFDREFTIQRSFKCPFLHHCHEISYDGERWIWVTSTSFDSILRFDTREGRFDGAWYIGIAERRIRGRVERKLLSKGYDPTGGMGPAKRDTLHINQVFCRGGSVYFSALRMDAMWTLGADGAVEVFAKVPVGTHNCQPIGGGGGGGDRIAMNATKDDCAMVTDRNGRVVTKMEYPLYDESAMTNTDLGEDYARQGFGRGLCVSARVGVVIAGSSPGTVSAFAVGSGERLRSVNVSMDIRNAPHGLEVWPF